MTRTAAAALALAIGGAWVSPAFAQTPAPNFDPGSLDRQQRQLQQQRRLRELDDFALDTRVRANQDVPVGQRVLFDYGAFVSFNYYSIDDPTGENHILRQYDLVGYARMNIDGANEFFVRGRTGWLDFNDGDSFDGRGDEPIDGDIDRAYYRFDLARALGAYQGTTINGNFVFQGGRDLVYWGNGLALGTVLDGAVVDLSYGPVTLELVGGITPIRTVDFDASRPNFDHNTRRGFYGGMLSADVGKHRPFVYGLAQSDYNADNFSDIGSIQTKYQYDSYYIGAGSRGSLGDHLVYGLELVYEGGGSISNSFAVTGFGLQQVEQTNDEIQAWAADLQLDYLFNDSRNTRISFEQILASGDEDRGSSSDTFNGNAPGTKDRAFNSLFLVNQGLAFAPNLSNLSITRAGASTFPFANVSFLRRLQVGFDVLLFNKLNRYAALDERSRNFTYVGIEPDVYLNWQVTSDVTLTLRYGVFFPDHALVLDEDPRHFFYGGVTFAF